MHCCITKPFIYWLTEYRNDDDSSQKKLAGLLINQLKTVNSISELQEILGKIKETDDTDSTLTFFSDHLFFKQITSWIDTLNELVNIRNTTIEKLQTRNLTYSFESLLTLLNAPQFLLHHNAPLLLSLINCDTLDIALINEQCSKIVHDIDSDQEQQPDTNETGCSLM